MNWRHKQTCCTDYDADFDHKRIMMGISAEVDLLVQQVDVKGAFFYWKMDKEVYERQPKGFEEPGKEGHLWRLLSAMYGLKQESMIWGHTLTTDLKEVGFSNSPACPRIFMHETKQVVLLHYADDEQIKQTIWKTSSSRKRTKETL